jgi:iron(III) transport system ATP-binding protein
MPDAHLVLDRVTARERGRTVLHLSLALERGRTLALLGPRGAGKTAALLLLAGFLRPSLGTVLLAGRDITMAPPHARDIGMVFEQDALFPHLSVLDNVGFGLKMRGVARPERRRRAEAALATLGIGPLARLPPARLDPVEHRLVALARAAAMRPALLLVDEPADPADAPRREAVREKLGAALAADPVTAILATPDRAAAFGLGDRVALLRDGALAQIGTPRDLFERPATSFVAGFTGGCNLLPATLLGHTATGAVVRLNGATVAARARPELAAGPVVLCIRPHSVRLDPAGPVRGPVQSLSYQGALTRVTLRLAGGAFVAELPQAPAGLAPGVELALGWHPDDAWPMPAEA